MLAPQQRSKRDRRENPIVFLDVKIGEDAPAERLLIEHHDGSGGECTFDQQDDEPDENGVRSSTFGDENFILKHTGAGVLSMANSGPDTNTCQFYLHFSPAPSFDNKHVVFGCLLGEDSFATLVKINHVATERGDPKVAVWIANTGQLYPS